MLLSLLYNIRRYFVVLLIGGNNEVFRLCQSA